MNSFVNNTKKVRFAQLRKRLEKYRNKEVAIYGTGGHTKILLDFFNDEEKKKISGLIDRDTKRIEKEIFGQKVFSIEALTSSIKAIIISSDVYQQNIYERIAYLKEKGIEIIKIYKKEDYTPIRWFIEEEKYDCKYKIEILDKSLYNEWNDFVDISVQGCIFNKTWYLEAVEANYKIYVCRENKKIIGGMVLSEDNNKFIMPRLTQTLGILLGNFSDMKYATRISKEKQIIESLVQAIPECKKYDIKFNYNFKDWMPFMWKGYNQICLYTYVIEELNDTDKIYFDFKEPVKRNIKKAINHKISVKTEVDIDEAYEIIAKTFERQNMDVPYEFESLKNFDKVLELRKSRIIYGAYDEENVLNAVAYIVYDKSSAYYIMGGADPKYRCNGCQSLVLWEAIKSSSKLSKKFDFEGSNVRAIEEFFRGFGGIQKMYFEIWKDNDNE